MATRSSVEFVDEIPGIVAELPGELDKDQVHVANAIAKDAQRLAPRLKVAIVYPSFVRQPGWLAESIEVDTVPGGGSAIRVGAFWGLFQEYGTEHHDAQPFLEPAAELHETELIRRTRTTLRRLEK